MFDLLKLETLIVLIPALPLAAALVTAALGKLWLRGQSHWPTVLALALAFLFSLELLFTIRREAREGEVEAGDEVMRITLEGDRGPVDEVANQIVETASGTGADVRGPIPLPTQTSDAAPAHLRRIEIVRPGSNTLERLNALSLPAGVDITIEARDPSQSPRAPAAGYERLQTLWTWADVPSAYSHPVLGTVDLKIDVTLRTDPLTAVMLAMVTFVSLLVAIYSIGYMRGDPGYWRFFTYVALFVFSMTMLVSVSNFALLYVFWEAVGVCSYLLIGFWFQKPEAAAAGKKAFLVNRVGDFGFALGVFLLWTTYGTLDFHDSGSVSGILSPGRIEVNGYVTGGVGAAICLLLFLGACGKSAQFPLHVWLPDAMEGPTPVSALIHAATMVTAGVYLVARCAPLFAATAAANEALAVQTWWSNPFLVVAAVGCFTAVLAGVIAVTQTDLKRILAYSTVSQLGFMFLGLGAGTLAGAVAGMFHLFTHAFFKALLFLGAGNVMHAMGGVIDIRRFGGLRRLLPVTHLTFLFGSLALAGVVPFAGFWSKDQIIASIYERSREESLASGVYLTLFWFALAAALLTAFYTFRAFFLTFHGREQVPEEAGHHAHESPATMTLPLCILAICALAVGGYFEWTGGFADFLGQTPSLRHAPLVVPSPAAVATAEGAHVGLSHLALAAISTLVALGGVGLAAFLYLGDRRMVDALTRRLRPVYALSHGKFFLDQIYYSFVVWPLEALARLSYWFDRRAIDGLVDFVGRIPPAIGSSLRSLQIGLVQFYALAMVLGLLVLIGALLRWPI